MEAWHAFEEHDEEAFGEEVVAGGGGSSVNSGYDIKITKA